MLLWYKSVVCFAFVRSWNHGKFSFVLSLCVSADNFWIVADIAQKNLVENIMERSRSFDAVRCGFCHFFANFVSKLHLHRRRYSFDDFVYISNYGLFYEGKDGQTLNMLGVVLVLISALAYAVYMVALKNVKMLKRIKYSKITFYVMFFGLFVFFFASNFGLELQPINSWFMLACLLCSAVIPTIISLETMTIAIKLIGPTLSAILGALEPVTAVFIGVAVFNEHLSVRIVCGIILILAAVMMIVIGDGKKPKLDK